jgi:hypothetical protein
VKKKYELVKNNLRRLRQEDHELKISLGYMLSSKLA